MADRQVYENHGKVYKVTVIYVMHLKNSEFWFEVFFFLFLETGALKEFYIFYITLFKVTVQTNNLVF